VLRGAASTAGPRPGTAATASERKGDQLMLESQRVTHGQTQPVVVTLPAEIDISNADRVGDELVAAFAPGVKTVIADMTDTRFCDSTGISMLVVAHRKATASNGQLRLVVLSTTVLRALTLVRLDHLLPVYPSLADALEPEPAPQPPAAT
jgi:anti-sigma B factor antagonist